MKVPTSVTIEFAFHCSACGDTVKEEQHVWPRYQVMYVEKPNGWLELHGALFCTKHKVEMRIDGKNEWVEWVGNRDEVAEKIQSA